MSLIPIFFADGTEFALTQADIQYLEETYKARSVQGHSQEFNCMDSGCENEKRIALIPPYWPPIGVSFLYTTMELSACTLQGAPPSISFYLITAFSPDY